MNFKEIKNVKIDATLATAQLRNDEAKTLINIFSKRLATHAFNCEDLTEWEENELIEYAFSCAEELTKLESLANILDDVIVETGYAIGQLDELVFEKSDNVEEIEETPEEVEEDGI
ncbi:hypothetical protein QP860_03515 [Aerococcus sp. UMB1112A]|uniref:hypothetical protein n=1 Tax=Aerococcus sp. UMB1112A TaxID=3050609 RepID=UPI00254A52DF|nr:hypothetical protein [Aerococcus sp. UMB1112A]MDK8502117.1 hypothetical protein [Aerococcus sp. UMB1112A]